MKTTDILLDHVWTMPCNPAKYDIFGAFNEFETLEWSQNTRMEEGDIVYLYVGNEYGSIMFKCEVVAANLYTGRTFEDLKYYIDLPEKKCGRYMIVKLLEKYPKGKYPLKELRENGLKSIQGRSRVSSQLFRYLEGK